MNKLDLEILELFLQLTKTEKHDVLAFAVDLIERDSMCWEADDEIIVETKNLLQLQSEEAN